MFRETNWGVYASATTADREVVENHGRMICLEDDVVVAPDFLDFINSGLDYFEGDSRIYSISGYCQPIVFPKDYLDPYWLSFAHVPWGFGTWKDRYFNMDPSWNPLPEIKKNWRLYGKMLKYCTWILTILEGDAHGECVAGDARLCGQMMLKGMVSVVPKESRSKNIGFDRSGIHGAYHADGDGVVLRDNRDEVIFSTNVEVDYRLIKLFNEYISSPHERTKVILGILGLRKLVKAVSKLRKRITSI